MRNTVFALAPPARVERLRKEHGPGPASTRKGHLGNSPAKSRPASHVLTWMHLQGSVIWAPCFWPPRRVREAADAGSIPAASTLGFKPNMDRDNRYIPRVIENGETPRSTHPTDRCAARAALLCQRSGA